MAQTLGEHVRARRTDMKLSQADLGAKMGFDKSYISHIELGRAKRASFALLEQIAGALDEPIEELLQAIGQDERLKDGAEQDTPEQARIIAFTRARLGHLTPEQTQRLIRAVEAGFGEQAPD